MCVQLLRVHHHFCVIPNSLTLRGRGEDWRMFWCDLKGRMMCVSSAVAFFPWCVAYREVCNFSLEVSFLVGQNYFCHGGQLFQCCQIQWKLLSSSWSFLRIWPCGSLLSWNILPFVATFFSFHLFHWPLSQSSFWAPPSSKSHRPELWTFSFLPASVTHP